MKAISRILISSVFPILFILYQPEIHAQSWSRVASWVGQSPQIIQREANRIVRQFTDQTVRLGREIDAFPQQVQDEIQRLENLGEAREKIEDEIRRLEKELRDKTRNIGNQIQDAEFSFDLNKHWNAVIVGSGAQLILEAIITNQALGPIALAQFLNVELNLHMEILDLLFVLKDIQSHMDRQQGLDCFRQINFNPLSIQTDIRNCLDDNLSPNYATSIIANTPQAVALFTEYDVEMTRRIVEIGKAQDSLHAAKQSALGLNSAMAQATTQMLRALICSPNDPLCP